MLIMVMVYSFAGVGAWVKMQIEDYCVLGHTS